MASKTILKEKAASALLIFCLQLKVMYELINTKHTNTETVKLYNY